MLALSLASSSSVLGIAVVDLWAMQSSRVLMKRYCSIVQHPVTTVCRPISCNRAYSEVGCLSTVLTFMVLLQL